jgi:transcriptional regulator with XRE-family HTH domain
VTGEEMFGRNLFMARRRLGVSQETLAKMAGLNRNTVYLLENDKGVARLDTIWLLARVLGVKPSELVDGLRCMTDAGPESIP